MVRARVRGQCRVVHANALHTSPGLRGEMLPKIEASIYKERKRGRTIMRPLFQNPQLSTAVDDRAKREGWTLSAAIEQVCVEFAKLKANRKG